MKKSLTILELVAVMLIMGVLAVLGFIQYSKTLERARGAEAKAVLGVVRRDAVSYWFENRTISGLLPEELDIGPNSEQAPDTCRPSHYFSYTIYVNSPVITISATRCTAKGKEPQGKTADTVILTSDLATGQDTWSGSGDY